MERRITYTKQGGKYQKSNCISREQYSKLNPTFNRFTNRVKKTMLTNYSKDSHENLGVTFEDDPE